MYVEWIGTKGHESAYYGILYMCFDGPAGKSFGKILLQIKAFYVKYTNAHS
jgi:hypothetical protein